MRQFLSVLFLFFFANLLFAGGEAESTGEGQDNKLSVFVSILPQKTFVEQIGGDRVEVHVMVEPGKSPATYSPTPKQVSELGGADVFFTIGVAFERGFLPMVQKNLEDLTIVDTSEGINKRMIEEHDHDEDEHDNDGHDHDSEEPDPHTWMSPVLVRHQAGIIAETLASLDPDGADYYDNNLTAFQLELDELDKTIATALNPLEGETLFVYHPAFGYFADRYGLKQIAIETGGKEPSPGQLEEIISYAKEEGVRVIFVQPEFPADSAAAVAKAIEGAVVTVTPLAEDYFNNLKGMSAAISEYLGK